jgi:hypothetical protein
MVENDENSTVGRFDVSSKFMRVLLIIVTVILIFVGPTYFPYVLTTFLDINHLAAVLSGFVLFFAGLLLMLFLIRKKIIT